MPYIEVTEKADLDRGLMDISFPDNIQTPTMEIFTKSEEIANTLINNIRAAARTYAIGYLKTPFFTVENLAHDEKTIKITGNIYNAIEFLKEKLFISSQLHAAIFTNNTVKSLIDKSKTFDQDIECEVSEEIIDEAVRIMSGGNEMKNTETSVNDSKQNTERLLAQIQQLDTNSQQELLMKLANCLKSKGLEITVKNINNQSPSSKVF